MKEEIDEKIKCRIILTVLFIVTVLLLFFGGLLIMHGKQVNPGTVEVKPQQLIMGTELEKIEIIPIDVAYLVFSEEISLTKMMFDFGRNITLSTIKQLGMIDEYICLLEDINSLVVKAQINMKELVIPAHSVYSGTKGLVLEESSIENTFENLGLNRLWFSTEMHVYAWHTEYELFDETEKVENHYILVYHDAFLYLRTQHTNSTKEVIELFGGKIKLS